MPATDEHAMATCAMCMRARASQHLEQRMCSMPCIARGGARAAAVPGSRTTMRGADRMAHAPRRCCRFTCTRRSCLQPRSGPNC